MIADQEYDGIFLAKLLPSRHPELCRKVVEALTEHGISVRWLTAARDIWAKDFSPLQVVSQRFVQFRYEPDYLEHHPDLRTPSHAVTEAYAELGTTLECSVNLDGGNIVTSGRRAITTDKIYRENPHFNREELRREIIAVLDLDELIVIPKEPYDPIGHADAMVRFIDAQQVLLNDYSSVDAAFGTRLQRQLERHGLQVILLPYFQERLTKDGIPSAVGCYTNFLLTSRVLLAPIYHHSSDAIALETLRLAFPNIPVVPLDPTQLAREGGVLNCIGAGFQLSQPIAL